LSLVLLARSMLVLPVLGAVKLRRAGRMGSRALRGTAFSARPATVRKQQQRSRTAEAGSG